MSTRRVRPQAAAPSAGTPDEPAAPQRPQRGRAAPAPATPAASSTSAPTGRPVRGRSTATTTASARAERRPAAAAAPVRVEPLVVFAPRSAAAKDDFFGPMASVMADLYEVLHMEIAALDAGTPEKLEILRHRKDGLANIYLEALVNLRRDESLKARLDEVDRVALRKAGEALRVATTENMRRLQARIDTVTGIINSVIEAARTGGDDALKVYEPDGTVGASQRPTARLGLDTAL
ncbi:hypothetical protein ACM64Y_09240 [Novispirillum sp. DQ9]|uniref:hypothetical protein n=1 Tax=Novispirillum sp. DQ9 TaxID=3398612 RepID=UPI003C7B57D8